MSYIEGFVLAVPDGRKEDYRSMAEKAEPVFIDHGARRHVEAWGDDVPEGKVTDFRRSVKAEAGESIVFSWIEWPDKAARDAGTKAVMADARMEMDPKAMPFDGKRMIYGGFAELIDNGSGVGGYFDGCLIPVENARRDDYRSFSQTMHGLWREKGALRVADYWGDDIPDGKLTDFRRAVNAKDGEAVVFSWVEWPDKPTRDKAVKAVMEDPRMTARTMPFDGQRMIYGGFAPILDSGAKS